MGISSCVLDAFDTYTHPEAIIRSARKLVVFGTPLAHVYGRKPDCITTIDKTYWGTEFEGVPIVDHKDAILQYSDALFVIHHMEARAIAAHLRKLSITNYIDITHFNWRNAKMMDYELLQANIDKIASLYDLLQDDASRTILDGILLFRLTFDPEVLNFSPYVQYLHPATPFGDKELIIDGGAFNGDSAFRFFLATNNDSIIYCFEPEEANIKELYKYIKPYKDIRRAFIIPKGLWSSSGKLSFSSASQSSRLDSEGLNTINVIGIDEFCDKKNIRPTLIKLDVEGAEMEVIKGAKKSIARDKPKMMISVYHCGDHLWEIPHAIKSMNSDYRFFLGHHSPNLTIYETILYAFMP